jgi:hypothetical protein
VADEQQVSIGGKNAQRSERLGGVEAFGQRRVHSDPRAQARAPLLGGQLRGLAGTHLGAEQHGVEIRAEPRQREPCGSGLSLPTRGQTALGVRARAVRLRLGVT